MPSEPLTRLTPEQARHRRRVTAEVLWVCAAALVPWTIYLAVSLPMVYSTRHWAVAWAGFDVLELIALAATAYFGWKGRQALLGTAIAAATLLICDAWFDITLDLGTPNIWWSVGSAVLLELPLAFFLLHRVALILRLMMLRFYPAVDERGKKIRLYNMPLVVLLPYNDESEQRAETEAGQSVSADDR